MPGGGGVGIQEAAWTTETPALKRREERKRENEFL